MIKCDYCPDNAHSIYNEEFLCKRHYAVLAPKKNIEETIHLVHKTHLEKKLNAKYTELINDFTTKEEFDSILEGFLVDVEIIRNNNEIYSEI